jgi:formate-dependent nitrite reductase membrane component NrfD
LKDPRAEENYSQIPIYCLLTLVFLYHDIGNGDGAKVNTKSNAKKRIVVSTVLSTGLVFLGLALVLLLHVWRKQQQKKRTYSTMKI